ncbi:MAG: hypothetical protein KC503_20330, partial [Myxococcales bacterium]|nr:hypothetical protein [Myxococcales bacterium]
RALREHLACVREVARSPASEGVALLAAVEVDIEPDGALALEAALLREADWVVASLHAALDQTRDELTRRLVRAIDSGVVDCIGHPLGHVHFDARELGEGEGDDALDAGEVEAPRPALPIDFDAVVYAAARADVALELDGHPARLDLDAEACRRARGRGALLALSSDARSLGRVGDLELALTTARRGWVEARHVLNARDVQALRAARERRLSGQGRAFDGLRRGERVERSGIARVAAELEAQPSEALLERLRAWLQGEDDGEIGEALALLSPEPMQLAVEILIAGDRAIGPRTSA